MRKVVLGFICLYLFTSQLLASELITLPRAISQDSQGFIWVGTQISAIKYDGHNQWPMVKDYGYINNIRHDGANTYVAASLALVRIDQYMTEQVIYEASRDNRILDVSITPDSYIIATQRELLQFNRTNNTVKSLFNYEAAKLGQLYQINSQVCLQLIKSLHCSDGEQRTFSQQLTNAIHSSFLANNKIYLVSAQQLFVFDGRQISKLATFDRKVNRAAKAIEPNQLWAVVDQYIALYNYNTNEWLTHDYQRVKRSQVHTLYESHDRSLWLAGTTLEKINESSLTTEKINGLGQNSGLGWLVTEQHQQFIVDVQGVYRIHDNTATLLPQVSQTTKGYIFSALAMPNQVWLGGYYGLFSANLDDDAIVDYSRLVAGKSVQCIREIDGFNLAVCAPDSGVYLIEPYNSSSTLKIDANDISGITDVLPLDTELNSAWLATDQGVYFFNAGNYQQLLPSSHAIRIAKFKNNHIFVATIDDGVFEIKKEQDKIIVNNIVLPGLGERIHDVRVTGDDLHITSSLGVARFNIKTQEPSIWQLGEAVGRIHSNIAAISANGHRIKWSSKTTRKAFAGQLRLSHFKVNGRHQVINQTLPSNAMVEMAFSTTNYQLSDLHQYRIKINDHDWTSFSSINHISFIANWGINQVKVQALNGQTLLQHQFSFVVDTPWYGTWWAISFYCLLFIVYCLLLLSSAWHIYRRITSYQTRLVEQDEKFKQAVEQINHENQLQTKAVQQQYQSKLKRIANQVLKNNENLVVKLYERNTQTVKKEYQPLINQLKKIDALLLTEHYQKAQAAINDLVLKTEIEAMLSAPDVLAIDTNLVAAIEQLMVAKQSSQHFLSFDQNIDRYRIIADDAINKVSRHVYKVINELIDYLIHVEFVNHIDIVLSKTKYQLNVCINIDDHSIKQSSFNHNNLGLYQAKLLVRNLNSKIELTPYREAGTSIMFTVPIREKLYSKSYDLSDTISKLFSKQ